METPPIAIRVLGPLEVVVAGHATAVPGHQARIVLSALVVALGHAVSPDQLQLLVWSDDPPTHWAESLQSLVSRLRRLLGAEAIVTSCGGYTLTVDPETVDAVRFERLLIAADVATEPTVARRQCRDALALWRGPPFGDVGDCEFARVESIRLDELRMTAMEMLWSAELALGRARWITAPLMSEVEDDPYRESLWALLIEALVATGRRREAAAACARVWHLMGQVGLEPGDEIRTLEDELFAGGRHGTPRV